MIRTESDVFEEGVHLSKISNDLEMKTKRIPNFVYSLPEDKDKCIFERLFHWRWILLFAEHFRGQCQLQ